MDDTERHTHARCGRAVFHPVEKLRPRGGMQTVQPNYGGCVYDNQAVWVGKRRGDRGFDYRSIYRLFN